ncbi:Methyltransferase domain protein [Rubripirellula obstinata]|uniref:Methyltransferase domain protein n=1 Tax=Rubripirellula obstinata TaxID=406547 RepID=A0A5B1CG08_9BACT|nr:class I SAM-dependent methyltransferase [Rubripirellula obstinata]KAA1259476.1 Methyltransferase domain protein [Rubripirellula obstinata]
MANLDDAQRVTRASIAGYDRLSSVYRLIERVAFGGVLMRARKSLAGELADAQHILVLGDGDGRLLTELTRLQIQAKFTSIEQSPKMLQLQRTGIRDVGAEKRVEFIQGDATLPDHFNQKYDAVVAAFFLDCFDSDSLDRLLPMILGSIADDGEFYFVDFCEPSKSIPRLYSKWMLWMMHQFFAWQTGLRNRKLVDVPKKLRDLGWDIQQQQDHHFKMMTARIYKRRVSKTASAKLE